VGYGGSGCSEHKGCNVSETEQNGAKVTTKCLCNVMYRVSIGVEMYDLE